MANNYLQFSEAIYKLSDDERLWLEARLRHLEAAMTTLDDGKNEDGVSCVLEDRPYMNGARRLGFQWAINQDEDEHYLWIYRDLLQAEHQRIFRRHAFCYR